MRRGGGRAARVLERLPQLTNLRERVGVRLEGGGELAGEREGCDEMLQSGVGRAQVGRDLDLGATARGFKAPEERAGQDLRGLQAALRQIVREDSLRQLARQGNRVR